MKDDTAVEIENIADDKHNSFEMNPIPLMALLDTGNVAATWHTHPDTDPNLSGEDYASFLNWPNLHHFIIGRREGKVVVSEYKIENGLVISCE